MIFGHIFLEFRMFMIDLKAFNQSINQSINQAIKQSSNQHFIVKHIHVYMAHSHKSRTIG